MPPPERANAITDIVVWPVLGYDEQGDFTYDTPYEIRGRWNDVKTQAVDRQGNKITLDGQAMGLTREVTVGSLMWKGALEEWLGWGAAGSGANDTELVQVKVANNTPDLKGRVTHYQVGFLRYRGAPP